MQSSAAAENAAVNENAAENVAKAPAAEKQNIAKEYANFESDVDYTTVLDDFEGPLDLLLHLINIAKINIEDVFVSQVTERFSITSNI